MPPFAEFFLFDGTTSATDLAGIFGVDFDHFPTGACSLVRTVLDKLCPSSIRDALVQSTFRGSSVREVFAGFILLGFWPFGKISRLQIFKHHHLIAIYQLL